MTNSKIGSGIHRVWQRFTVVLATLLPLVLTQSSFDYNGGVSLRWPNTTCPEGTYYEGVTYWPNCCPHNQAPPPGNNGACCDDGEDCIPQVVSNPKCADVSWIYCHDNSPPSVLDLGFCCLDGWICYSQLDINGNNLGAGCGAAGFTLQQNQTLVPIIYAAYAGPDAMSSSASVSSTSTPSSNYAESIALSTAISIYSTTAPRSNYATALSTSASVYTRTASRSSYEAASTTALASFTTISPSSYAKLAAAGSVTSASPTTTSPSTQKVPSGYGSLNVIALGCSIGIGLPATIAGLGSWWIAARTKRAKHSKEDG